MSVLARDVDVGRRGLPVFGWALLAVLGGIAVAVPDPLIVVLGVAGLAVTLLALIQPLVALPLVLLAIPFGSIGRGSAADASTTGTGATELSVGGAEIMIALLTVAWLACGIRRQQIRLHTGAIVIATVFMIALAALSTGYAEDKSAAIKETLKWIELLLALLIVVDLVNGADKARWVIGAMLLAGSAEATYGAFQFVTDSGPSAFALQGALRAFGHFDQPNPFAGYLATMLPLAVCMATCRGNPRWFRLMSAGFGLLIAGGVALSQSRGAWLGVAAAGFVLLLMWSRRTRRWLVPLTLAGAVGLALALSGVLPASIVDRVSQAVEYFGVFDVRTVQVTTDNWAVVERMAHWQAGWAMFVDHPWFGVGAGNYGSAYAIYFIGSWREALGHAHNYYINMLAELGLPGGTVLVCLLGIVCVRLGRPLVQSEGGASHFWRAVCAGVCGGIAVFCVHDIFDNLFVHSVNIQLGVLLGLGLVAVDHLRVRRLETIAP